MKGIKHIYDPIYRQNYYFFDVPTYEQYTRLQKKVFSNSVDMRDVDGNCAVFMNKGIPIVSIWVSKKRADIVSHECMHAVSWVLRRVGLPLNEDSEEAYCYLLQFLVENIMEKRR